MRSLSPDEIRERLTGLQQLAARARPSGATDVDFEAEGMLEGLDDEGAREARTELLEQLLDAGVTLDELKQAIAEDRLTLLPVERVLSGEGQYTIDEVAEKAKIDVDLLRRHRNALGLVASEDEERRYDDDDVEVAELIREFHEAGLPDDGLVDVARVLGQSMSRIAEALRTMVGEAFLEPGATERDLGLRYAEAVEQLGPMIDPILTYTLRLRLLELVRSDVVGRAALSSGSIQGADEVTVCFADLVDFTRLGEELPPDDLERVAGRLVEMAYEEVKPPVRLVKSIGDAVMLVSTEPQPILETAIRLVERAGDEGEQFPALRAGLATGQALPRGGDWYGRPVNLASRVAEIARPASVLATEGVRESLGEEIESTLDWSRAGRRRIKGIDKPVALFRVRREGERGGGRRGNGGDPEPDTDDSENGD